jgi:chaperonin GroES
MKPIKTLILFKPSPSDEVSEGGIFVPDSAREVNNKGTIVSVGNGTKSKPMGLKTGDVGFRVKNWGEEIIINGEKHYLMDQDAIIALV